MYFLHKDMKLIFLGLLVVVVAKPNGKISFSLIEERSSNDNPSVKVNFADGSSDFLVLSKYDGLDGHFIGHLENEKTACVAMVNHPEHTELTIMSDRTIGSTMYKWKNNGQVELIPEVFSNGETSIAMARADEGDDELIANQDEENEEFDIESNMSASQAATVPTTAKLQIKVGYDDSFLAKLGSASAIEAYWNAAAPHLQARYCHSTLGTKIKVERVGNFKHYAGKTLTATNANIRSMFDDTANDIGDADLITYMSYESNQYGVIGIAFTGVICDHPYYNKYKSSIVEWRSTTVAFAGVVAHEIGHNLGMKHDFDAKHGGQSSACNRDNHIMSYGSTQEKWSCCSKKDFRAHYLWVQQTYYVSWCMESEIGDVCGAPVSKCPDGDRTHCGFPMYKGDGYCDDPNNNCGCDWDGGDCCGNNVDTLFCTTCKCLDPNQVAGC